MHVYYSTLIAGLLAVGTGAFSHAQDCKGENARIAELEAENANLEELGAENARQNNAELKAVEELGAENARQNDAKLKAVEEKLGKLNETHAELVKKIEQLEAKTMATTEAPTEESSKEEVSECYNTYSHRKCSYGPCVAACFALDGNYFKDGFECDRYREACYAVVKRKEDCYEKFGNNCVTNCEGNCKSNNICTTGFDGEPKGDCSCDKDGFGYCYDGYKAGRDTEACRCKQSWTSPDDGDACATEQNGCTACDSQSPWCIIENPGCVEEEDDYGGRGRWAFCKPEEWNCNCDGEKCKCDCEGENCDEECENCWWWHCGYAC